MTATVVRIGNSNGIIIPARILKSLALSQRDSVEISELNGGIFVKKTDSGSLTTPFTALDRWNEDNGYNEEFSVDSVIEYADSIRRHRADKDIVEW